MLSILTWAICPESDSPDILSFQMVRVLVQNCVKANQLLYCEGKPVLTTAGHVRANNFAVSFPWHVQLDPS